MNTNVAYEVVDRRRGVVGRLSPVGVVEFRPGAVVVLDAEQRVVEVYPNADEDFIENADGTVDLKSADGTITLVPITQVSFGTLSKMLMLNVPDGVREQSDEALGQYLHTIIAGARE